MTNKEIEGFENYLIYDDGRVFSKYKNRFLKPRLNKNKKTTIDKCYYIVGLYKNHKRYFKLVHRLLAQAFIPNINNLEMVDHIDRNPQNNNLSNLRWVNNGDNKRNTKVQKDNKLGEKHIHKKKNRNLYIFTIMSNKKHIVWKSFKTLEQAIEYRNEYLKNNPKYKI